MPESTPSKPATPPEVKKNSLSDLLFELLINIVIPTLILRYLSNDAYLGSQLALIVALSFPIGFGLKELLTAHKVNFFSILGVITIALTGGMGLLKIDPQYIAIKEAAIPAAFGLFTLVSLKTRFPLVKTLLFNEKVLQVTRINEALQARNTQAAFERSLALASMILAASFFLSATTNYLLAKWVLVSQPGTEAFNQELGRMMVLSYPVNALPAMIILFGALIYIYKSVRKFTDLPAEAIFQNLEAEPETPGAK